MPAKPRKISGVVTSLVTPLTSTGDVDEQGLERLIDHQLEGGADALFILGSIGEGALVSDRTYERVARRAASYLGGRCRLLGGASDNSVERCLARLETLASAGVGFGVVTLPYYGWPPEHEHSVRFFSTIAANSPLPIVAYNLPKVVGWQMPFETLEALFAIPNLVCIKDTHDDFEQMARVASSRRRPTHFSYLPGNSSFAARLLEAGADGVVSTPANVFPDLFVEMDRYHRAGKHALVRRIDKELIPKAVELLKLLPTGIGSIKGYLEADGICSRTTVYPWPQISDEHLPRCRAYLKAIRAAIASFRASINP